ncbi:MAG TPA: hypothetical protein VGI39_11475 [Polyangiaceae bacterium]
MTWRKAWCFLLAPAMLVLSASSPAGAQATPMPNRDQNWGTVSSVTVATAGVLALVMPRVFYSDPEATVGWKARWHVSQLAPVMTLSMLSVLNEYALKDGIKGFRPGCDATNTPGPNCTTYGTPSTHAFAGSAALGQGVAVWLFDMTKWSGGRFNAGSFVGNVFLPLVLAGVTDGARAAGNFENGGQIIAGSLGGVALGFLSGMTYALMARPECGYTGNLICW